MFRSIRWRLLATHLVVILLALSFLGVHLARDAETRYLAQVQTGLLAQARLFAVHLRDAVATRDQARIQAELEVAQLLGNPQVIIIDRDQSVMASRPTVPEARLQQHLGREGVLLALRGQESAGAGQAGGVPVVFGAVPIRAGKAGAGEMVIGAVYLALPLVELAEQLRHIRVFVAWTILVTILWAALVSLLLAGRLAGPMQEMRAATGRMAAGDLAARVPVRTADELGELARSLNYMAAEIERLDAMRREFVADASHELRTPVANLAVAVEALKESVPTPDPAAAPLLDAIEREADRLRALVDALLDLSAIESGRVHLRLVTTDLGALARDVVGSFRPRAAQQGVALELAGTEGGPSVLADPDRTAQVLGNLLDNALRFTPSGGRVTVSVAGQRGKAIVRVDDTGPGIPVGDLPHIFDRFFKSDRSRSGRGGAGLGLAIARRLLVAQGGEITAENRSGGGARFTVTLPS